MTISPQRWNMPINQSERDAALFDLFPNATRQKLNQLTPLCRGGRLQALEKLQQVQGEKYGESRNFLNGQVTHLSPYLSTKLVTIELRVS